MVNKNNCRQTQVRNIKKQIKILTKSLNRLDKKKPVYYRNSKENYEIVKKQTEIDKLNRALELLQTRKRK